MAGQVVSSVMQLSTFTKITSIPRKETYTDFPVTLRVRSHLPSSPPPVDVVAVVDVSGSMRDKKYGPPGKITTSLEEKSKQVTITTRWNCEKEAVKVVMDRFGSKDTKDRLAVVGFRYSAEQLVELGEVTDEKERQKVMNEKIEGDTNILPALTKATEILDARKAEEKGRLAFIILFSDGEDPDLTDDKMRTVPKTYPIHTFGFWDEKTPTMKEMHDKKLAASYTRVNYEVDKVVQKLREITDELTSTVSVDARISLKSLHPGVTLSRIEPSDGPHYRSQIGEDDGGSGEISITVVTSDSDVEKEFTVFLNVPEGDADAATMELLKVGGSYRQSWDQRQLPLDESVVTVERPPPQPEGSCSCKELDEIAERLENWCKKKDDLSASYDGKCECLESEVLREASLEAINSAMHEDIYKAVLRALKLSHCGNDGTMEAAMENLPSAAA